jgi:hypothetical protein
VRCPPSAAPAVLQSVTVERAGRYLNEGCAASMKLAMSAAWNFAGGEIFAKAILEAGVLPPCIAMLKTKNNALRNSAVGALWAFTEFAEVQEEAVRQGLVEVLVDVLDKGSLSALYRVSGNLQCIAFNRTATFPVRDGDGFATLMTRRCCCVAKCRGELFKRRVVEVSLKQMHYAPVAFTPLAYVNPQRHTDRTLLHHFDSFRRSVVDSASVLINVVARCRCCQWMMSVRLRCPSSLDTFSNDVLN